MKNKSWLSDNIVSLLAITWTIFTMVIFMLILTRTVKTSESTTVTILATVSNVELIILTFYFSSTKSSKEKDKQLTDMITKTDSNTVDK